MSDGEKARTASSIDIRSAALDAIPVGVAVLGLDGEVHFVNRRAREIIRHRVPEGPDTVVGRMIYDALPHLEDLDVDRHLRALRDADPGETRTIPVFRARGTYKLTLERLPGGSVVLSFQDHDVIEAAYRAARRAAEPTERARAELETLRELYPFGAIAAFDHEYRYTSVTGQGWMDLGIDPDALIGHTFRELWDPGTAERLEELAGVALVGGQAMQRVPYEDGTHEVWAGPLPAEPDGQPRGLFVSRDVSVEVEQLERTRLLEQATDAAEVGVTLCDLREPDCPLIYASRGFQRLTGYSEDEVIGRNCRFLQGESTSQSTLDDIRDALEDGRPYRGTLLNYRRDGTPFWNRLTLAPFSVDGLSITHYVGIQEDVTEIRRSELEREHSRRLSELGSLAGGVAHDFNNLLMEIQGRLELCRDLDMGEALETELSGIRRAASRGAGLVDQLLTYAGQHDERNDPEEASSLVRDVIPSVMRLLPAQVAVDVRLPDRPVPLALPEIRLEQILLNLAKNASDAMPAGGTLTVEWEPAPEDQWGELTVRDDGTGIPPEVRGRVFDPFFTTKGSGGTGLGLSTVARVVERVGGSVEIHSEVDVGTEVVLRVPLADQPVRPRAEHPRPASPEPVESLAGLRILVVDDQEGIRTVLARLLRRRGLEVTVAANGREALDRVEQSDHGFDIVLADRDMPRMGGVQFLWALSEDLGPGDVQPWKVLISGDLRGMADELPPGTLTVRKPFEIPELLAALEGFVTGE